MNQKLSSVFLCISLICSLNLNVIQAQISNKSFSFNSNSFTIPNSIWFFYNTDFTIEAWIKKTGNENHNMHIFGNNAILNLNGNDYLTGFSIVINVEGYLEFNYLKVINNIRSPMKLASTSLFGNDWKHIAIVYQNSAFHIYENGQITRIAPIQPLDVEISFFPSVNHMVGENFFQNLSNFMGEIDNLKIYNKGKSQQEIINSFNNKCRPYQIEPNLLVWYPSDEIANEGLINYAVSFNDMNFNAKFKNIPQLVSGPYIYQKNFFINNIEYFDDLQFAIDNAQINSTIVTNCSCDVNSFTLKNNVILNLGKHKINVK